MANDIRTRIWGITKEEYKMFLNDDPKKSGHDKKYTYSKIVPYPSWVIENDLIETEIGMDFRWDHWGTKWDMYEVRDSQVSQGILSFYSAWGCPIMVIFAMHRRFPKMNWNVIYRNAGGLDYQIRIFEGKFEWAGKTWLSWDEIFEETRQKSFNGQNYVENIELVKTKNNI